MMLAYLDSAWLGLLVAQDQSPGEKAVGMHFIISFTPAMT